jgi:RNA polymerase sigma-70 factor (ECF subfamily)
MLVESRRLPESRPRPERSAKVVSIAFARSDADLLGALGAARLDAQAEVYRRYHGRVSLLLERLLGSDDDVAELMERTFLTAFQAARRFRGSRDTLGPWLDRLTVDTARERLRRGRWQRWFGFGGEAAAPLPSLATPTPSEIVRRFYGAVDTLPLPERLPFLLYWVDGMTLAQLADACSITTSTARRRLSRARVRFARHAESDGMLAALLGSSGS